MEYNISEAELPTMVVRYENKLILRSVITGQHLQDLGLAPVWDEVPATPALEARRQRIEAAHDAALEALVRLYPCEEIVVPPMPAPPQPQVPPQQPHLPQVGQPRVLPQAKPTVTTQPPSPLAVNETELPPCKVHRNYCCNYCSFCTQNPRSHLLHQRQIHGIRLSIHCCHHCQYASRYFQKLKRHVKMVHMGNSPGRTKIRNKIAARRAVKPKMAQAKHANAAEVKTQVVKATEIPSTTVTKAPTEQPAQIQTPQTQVVQKPNLSAPNVGAAMPTLPNAMPHQMPPAVFKNPEAFFEAAYRNQLIQQQMQVQRFKEFVKFSNQFNKATQQEASKITKPTSTTAAAMRQQYHQQQQRPQHPSQQQQQLLQNQVIHNMKPSVQQAAAPTAPSHTSNPPTTSTFNGNVVAAAASTLEPEKRRFYGCRKCSYVTHIKSRYNKHVKYHSMPMIQCDKCEFRTTYKWNLTRHLRSHHGNGLYKCSVCSFSAHMKQSLTSHELNHHSPPVGHVTSRMHNKPHRRRRCRVGGSDLVVSQPLTKTAPITADNLQQQQQLQQNSNSNLCSTVAPDGLKLVIKREAGTSSYSSSQAANLMPWKTGQTASKSSSSPSECLSSSYSGSPSSCYSTVSVVDTEMATNDIEGGVEKPHVVAQQATTEERLNDTNASNAQVPGALQTLNAHLLSQLQQLQNSITKIEPPQIPRPTPETMQQLINMPPAQPVPYTSSIDSDPDSDDSDGDSYSTVSANETVPHGLHIAYESSSPDRKSNSSSDSEIDLELTSQFQRTCELSQSKMGSQENATTLQNGFEK